jgi:hypothetical protein
MGPKGKSKGKGSSAMDSIAEEDEESSDDEIILTFPGQLHSQADVTPEYEPKPTLAFLSFKVGKLENEVARLKRLANMLLDSQDKTADRLAYLYDRLGEVMARSAPAPGHEQRDAAMRRELLIEFGLANNNEL